MKTSNFQIIVIGICVLCLLGGVGVFAAFGGLGGGKSVGPVTIWGTMDAGEMSNLLSTLRASDKSFQDVQYVQKDPSTYDSDLLNAMASGQGPDLFMVDQDELESFANKVDVIPYSSISQSQFTNSYIDEGSLFLTSQGALALPFSVDPLVMYWNRDLFAAAGLASPPVYWNDLLNIAPKITSLDQSANVDKSAVALGTWANIPDAKQILSTLFLQAGDPITQLSSSDSLEVVFGQTPQGAPENPAESALRFYTEFADPSKTTYSWNNALEDSTDEFTSGDLAIYFGFASEYQTLAARNPNLHFSVALVPQLEGNSTHVTFGNLTGVAISRTAANPSGALTIAEKLTSQAAISQLVQLTGLPPARRDVILDTSSNAAAQVFVQSSLISQAWLEPTSSGSDAAFEMMIDDVLSGAQEPAGAVAEGSAALQELTH